MVLWKRWLSRGQPSDSPSSENHAEQQILAIQSGDESLRESFIIQYRPFIAKTASRFCRRYIDPNRDDEFSVALTAFNEAIDSFSAAAGGRFVGFAETVITRRLIDYVRQEQRHSASLPYSALAPNGEEHSRLERLEYAAAQDAYEQDRIAELRSAEIAVLSEQLAKFGIRFQDLASESPKHRDSREALLQLGAQLAGTPALFDKLLEKRQLPIKELCSLAPVSRKTVERNRKYLIAVSLIAGGAYPCLRQYIQPELDREEGRQP